MTVLEYDILLVGYGVTGKMIANLLGQQGWKVGVIDPYENPYGLPRAIKYDHEVLRNLQSIMPDELIEEVSVWVPDDYLWVNGQDEKLLALDWSLPGISGWPQDAIFNHAQLEFAMDSQRPQYDNVDAHLGYKVVFMDRFDDYVELTFRQTNNIGEVIAGGEIRKARAKYVIGADGANSFIRENMPHKMESLGFMSSFYVIDVILNEEREFTPMNKQIADPKRPSTMASGGPGKRRRWEFMLMPGEDPIDFKDIQVAWDFLKDYDVTPENATIERHVVYTFKAKWADHWRDGRLVIAGDAAHLTPPFLGQGLSSGIRDAASIAWRMDLIFKGIAPETILDSYSEERRPHMEALIRGAEYLGKIITVVDEEKAAKRDDDFKNGRFPAMPEFPGLEHGVINLEDATGLGGSLSLQAKVEKEGNVDRFDNFFGHGFRIITLGEDVQLDAAQQEFFESIGGKVIRLGEDALDTEGKYQAYFEEHGIKALIVRPDFYVYSGVKEISEINELIKQLESKIKE